jgi:hypothetical protein
MADGSTSAHRAGELSFSSYIQRLLTKSVPVPIPSLSEHLDERTVIKQHFAQ